MNSVPPYHLLIESYSKAQEVACTALPSAPVNPDPAPDTMTFHSAVTADRPPTHLMPMSAAERRRSASCAP